MNGWIYSNRESGSTKCEWDSVAVAVRMASVRGGLWGRYVGVWVGQ